MSYQKGFNYLATLGVDTNGIIRDYTNRRLNRKPIKSFDGRMYDAIKGNLQVDGGVAKQVNRAIKDDRITKSFCDVQSLYAQVGRFTDASSFTRSMINNVNYMGAWSILREMFPKPNRQLIPLSLNQDTDISTIFSNPHASAGILAYPLHKEDCTDLIKDVAIHITQSWDKSLSFPAIALTRSQITDYVNEGIIDSKHIKYKTRLVMCVDASSVLVEQLFGQPLLDFVFRNVNQYAGGMNDNGINQYLLKICRGKYWVSLDYSKFDATIQGWLIRDCFNFLSEYFPEEYKVCFDWIANNFINMQLLMPNGEIVNLHKGIKSGSFFTQMVGSMCNMLMVLTYLCSYYGHENGNRRVVNFSRVKHLLTSHSNHSMRYATMMVMGDDNIIFTTEPLNVESMSKYLKKNFGTKITVDGEKAYSSGDAFKHPEFLKRTWNFDGQSREEVEMWVNLLHPERRRSYDEYSEWHILYGYYLTFNRSVRKYFSEEEILQGMATSTFGIEGLGRMKLSDMPGSLRSQFLNHSLSRDRFVLDAKNRYRERLC